MNLKRALALVLMLGLMVLCGCTQADAQQTETQPALTVISTVFPPYDFARVIGGERAQASTLLKPGAESHSFDPSPTDILNIQNCDVFLYIGGENDAWVDDLLSTIDTSGVRLVRLMDCVETLAEEEHAHGERDEHEHMEGAADEHIWTSPRNAAAMADAIAQAMCAADPQGEEIYRENLAAYQADLSALDADLSALVEGAQRRVLVFGDRFPFRYLAADYGLEYEAAFPGCSTDAEPSVQTIARLIDRVRAEQIPAVYHIEQGNERVTGVICEETGATPLLLHSCHNLTQQERDAGASYLSLMRQNLEALRIGLY